MRYTYIHIQSNICQKKIFKTSSNVIHTSDRKIVLLLYIEYWLINKLKQIYPKFCSNYLLVLDKISFSVREWEYSQKTKIFNFSVIINACNIVHVYIEIIGMCKFTLTKKFRKIMRFKLYVSFHKAIIDNFHRIKALSQLTTCILSLLKSGQFVFWPKKTCNFLKRMKNNFSIYAIFSF